jgi:hypothetical protein
MDKIPVGATIGHAYSFAFKDFLKILGVMWVPFVIMMAATLALGTQVTAFTNALTTKNFAEVSNVISVLGPAYILFLFLIVMQILGITELALGKRQGASPYFFFTLGKPLWRLIGAYLLVVLLLIAAILVFVFAAGILAAIFTGVTGVAKGAKPSGAAAGVLGLAVIIIVPIVYCAFIYGLVRQTFFLTPVVVAEERLGLRRAWSLGRGNFWRMFVIILALLVPFVILEGVFLIEFVWQGLPPTAAQGATPEQITAWSMNSATRMQHYWFVLYPVYLIVSVIFYGYVCGAQAFAYRSLVPAEKAEDVF